MDRDSTIQLLQSVRDGSADALERLISRYLPRLRTWTHRRLPAWARHFSDTEDLVQETALRTIRNLHTFEMRDNASLRAYMKRAVQNRVRDELKRALRHPQGDLLLAGDTETDSPSPADQAIARENLRRCRIALARLRPADRDLILAAASGVRNPVALAARTGRPSGAAARVALARALTRLKDEVNRVK